MKRAIPPKTMGTISRLRKRQLPAGKMIRLAPLLNVDVNLGKRLSMRPVQRKPSADTDFPTGLVPKPRNWRFQTKPFFKKIKGPLVDVFHEAEEVLIVIDLGGFNRG